MGLARRRGAARLIAPAAIVVAVFLIAGPGAAVAATLCECGSCSCGGGGGALELGVNGDSPWAGGPEACVTTSDLCGASGEPTVLTEPISTLSAVGDYATNFYMLASGGSGTYTYEWDFNGWVLGNYSTTNEFSYIGDYTVDARVLSGTGTSAQSVTLSMAVDVVVGTCPSSCSVTFTNGTAGYGVSLNNAATEWVVLVMKAEGSAIAAEGQICTTPDPSAQVICDALVVPAGIEALLDLYADWLSYANEGKGVCFEITYYGVYVVVPNPCAPILFAPI